MIQQLRVVAKVAAVHWAAAEHGAAAPPGEPLVPNVEASPPVDLKRWGPLELRHEIGSGQFGTVYRAWTPASSGKWP